jgi:hypothetical protein
MAYDKDLTGYIDAYLDGSLAEEALQNFESKMQDDPEFLLEVEAQRAIRSLVRQNEAKKVFQNFEEEIQQELMAQEQMVAEPAAFYKPESGSLEASTKYILEDTRDEENVIPLNSVDNFYKIAFAATVSLLIVFAGYYWIFNKSTEKNFGQEVFAHYTIDVQLTDSNIRNIEEKMVVTIIKDENLDHHYRFSGDTVFLYFRSFEPSQQDLALKYDPEADLPYRILITDKLYQIDESVSEPVPLIEIDTP